MGRLLWAGFVVTVLVSAGGLSTSLSAERFTRRTVERERARPSMEAVAAFAEIADAIVEVRLVDQVAFEVTARLCGPLDPGEAIPLTQFGSVGGAPGRDMLRLYVRLPVVAAVSGSRVASAPTKADRFLLFLVDGAEHRWRFAQGTEGDLFLLSGGRVFQIVYGGSQFWTPYFWEPFAERAELERMLAGQNLP